MVHVGIGYDVHQLVAGRKLVLGGVEIPHPKGLDGHSDADALMHAICDAVLGALGEADIGHFFPNTDPRWRGVPSSIFLEEAARQVLRRNGVEVEVVGKFSEGRDNVVERILAGEIDLVLNTPWGSGGPRLDGYEIRTAAVAAGIPCLTTVQAAAAAVQGIEELSRGEVGVRSLQDLHAQLAAWRAGTSA